MIKYILGKMLGVEALLLLLPAVVSCIYKESTGVDFLITAVILLMIYLMFGISSGIIFNPFSFLSPFVL